MSHTPGPIGIPDTGTGLGYITVSAGSSLEGWNGLIAQVDAGNYARSQDEGLANARRLVLCWNAHDDLLAACELFAKWDGENCQDDTTPYDAVKSAMLAAIAKAKGGVK